MDHLTSVDNTEIDSLYGNKFVSVANSLLQAREKASLLESKIELLAIARMNENMEEIEKKDIHGHAYKVHLVRIKTKEIKLLCGNVKGGGIYRDIMGAAAEMKRKIYIIADEKSNQFEIKSLYGDARYSNGTLEVEFNPDTEFLFTELKQNYAKIRLDIAFKFQTNGGLQLYKLLRTYLWELPDMDESTPQEELPYLTKEYTVSQLRLLLGYVDLNQRDIQKEAVKKSPDYDKIEEMEKKPKYKRWSDFSSRVLEPGIKEINSNSDIYISSIETQKGAHGKIEGVSIKMQHNRSFHEEKMQKKEIEIPLPNILSEEDIDDFLDEMQEFMVESYKIKDLKAIAKAADYDMDRIKSAYGYMKSSSSDKSNAVGYMIAAIKNDYARGPRVMGSAQATNGFHNFSGRDYSDKYMEEMEQKLINSARI